MNRAVGVGNGNLSMTAVFFGEMGYFDHRITLLISASCALLLVYSRI